MRDIYSSQVKDVHKRLKLFFFLLLGPCYLIWVCLVEHFVVGAPQLLGFCVCVGSRPKKHPL